MTTPVNFATRTQEFATFYSQITALCEKRAKVTWILKNLGIQFKELERVTGIFLNVHVDVSHLHEEESLEARKLRVRSFKNQTTLTIQSFGELLSHPYFVLLQMAKSDMDRWAILAKQDGISSEQIFQDPQVWEKVQTLFNCHRDNISALSKSFDEIHTELNVHSIEMNTVLLKLRPYVTP